MATAPIPASSGPITSLVGRNGFFTGYNITATAAGRVRFWSGLSAGTEGTGTTLLADVNMAAAGTVDITAPDIRDGEQYINGIYCEQVSGTAPVGFIRFRGPHS